MARRAPSSFVAVLTLAILCAALTAQEPRQGAQPPSTVDPETSCTKACHQKESTGPFVHGLLKEGACTDCHMQEDEEQHEFAAIEDASAMCKLCHEIELDAVVHEPLNSAKCTDCHDPHRSEVASLLAAPDQPSLCAKCHAETVAALEKEHPHGPATLGECTMCHGAHSAPEERLLRQETNELCRQCHTDMVEAIDQLEWSHAPVAMNCALCHDPHGSDQPFVLRNDVQQLCLSCHDKVEQHLGAATMVHGAIALERSCVGCHQPHGAKFPKLLGGSVRDNCVECHSKAIERKDGPPVAAIGALLAEKKFLHGPVREGNCSECHQPHAAVVQDLLLRQYPPRFYAAYTDGDYELCFGCHDRKVFETAETDSLTNFRDGKRNLHFLHVSREQKGRTCRACHEVHASNLPKHLAEKVPFGNWMLPLNYEQAVTGGSCAPGCHKQKQYDYGESRLPKH